MRSAVFGFLLVLCVGVAHADNDASHLMIYGNGVRTCGTYVTEQHGSPDKVMNVTWALGFITGVGIVWKATVHTQMADTDEGAVEIWLNNYCQAHPLEQFANAVNALAETLLQQGEKQ